MSDEEYQRPIQQQDKWSNFQQTPQCFQQYKSRENLLPVYQSLVNQLTPLTTISTLAQQKLKHHRIALATRSYKDFKSHDFSQKSQPVLVKSLHYGYHCVYKVTLGIFSLEINILNVHRSSDDQDASIKQDQLGSGGFGTVRSAKIGNQLFAIKRINFIKKREEKDEFDIEVQLAEKQQIKRAIQQYAMYKICSMLGVGPQIIFRENYDLICYNNCLQFLMELCLAPSKCQEIPLDMLASDLMSSLKTLHDFHFVHRDIKPDNILYSQAYGRFVFADFGLAHPLAQEYYKQSQTLLAGTLEYLSPQMMELSEKRQGKVNLYLNDFYSLRLTIEKLQKIGTKSFSYQGNSMSFKASTEQMVEYEQQNSNTNSILSIVSTNQSQQKSYSNIFQQLLHSLEAPSRSASQINFYQSEILFKVFRIFQTNIQVSKQQLQTILKMSNQQIQDLFVKSLVTRYVKGIFFPIDEEKSRLCLLLSYLKNAARHFGPKSLEVQACIEDIIKQIDSHSNNHQAILYFTELKQALLTHVYQFRYEQNQHFLNVLIYLRKYDLLIDYFLKFLTVNARLTQVNSQLSSLNYRLLCCLYIICQHSQTISYNQLALINVYFAKIFDKEAKSISLKINAQKSERNRRKIELKYQTFYLMKIAVQTLVQREYYHLAIYIKAFQFYLQSFIKPNREEIKFYMDILVKIEIKSQQISLKLIEIICNKFYMIQFYCKFYMFLDDYQQKIKQLVAELLILDNESKLYYLLSLNRLTAFFLNKNQGNKAQQNCQQIMKELSENKQLIINDLQLFSIKADLYKHYGVCHFLKNKVELCLQYLNRAKNQIILKKSPQNFIKDMYEINRNIALCYYKSKMYKQALNTYNRIIIDLEKSKKDMILQKAFVYRSILVIYIEMGIVFQHPIIVSSTIENIVKYTALTLQNYDQSHNGNKKCTQKVFNFFEITKDKKVQIFLMQKLRASIKQYIDVFQQVDQWLNLNLFDLYYRQIKMPDKAMHCLSRYIVSILNKVKVFTIENVENMNYYAQKLIDFKLSHKACLFLSKFIFTISPQFKIQRQRAFLLYNRALRIQNNQWHVVTYQLVKNNFALLSSLHYDEIKLKTPLFKGTKWKKLLQKWITKLSNNILACFQIQSLGF